MNSRVVDDPPLWKEHRDTWQQMELRRRILHGERLRCWHCSMVWTAGPYAQVPESELQAALRVDWQPSVQTRIEYVRPYTDVARRDVHLFMVRGGEIVLVCRECGEELIALNKQKGS